MNRLPTDSKLHCSCGRAAILSSSLRSFSIASFVSLAMSSAVWFHAGGGCGGVSVGMPWGLVNAKAERGVEDEEKARITRDAAVGGGRSVTAGLVLYPAIDLQVVVTPWLTAPGEV